MSDRPKEETDQWDYHEPSDPKQAGDGLLPCPEIVIDYIGGNCPVQAEGAIDGKPFYFRARGGHWSMSIGGKDVIGRPDWYFEAPYPDPAPTETPIYDKQGGKVVDKIDMHYAAGWMDESAARSFIYTAAVLYASTRPTSPADGEDKGAVSDGYHTFNELYEHRHILFLHVLKSSGDKAWRSKLHSDGTMFDGWFIAGLETDLGQATYHLPLRMWSLFDGVREINHAPEWDGHTSNDVLVRIRETAVYTQPAPEPKEDAEAALSRMAYAARCYVRDSITEDHPQKGKTEMVDQDYETIRQHLIGE